MKLACRHQYSEVEQVLTEAITRVTSIFQQILLIHKMTVNYIQSNAVDEFGVKLAHCV